MNYLNLFIALSGFIIWVALFAVYKREALREWYENRFVPDSPPEEEEKLQEELEKEQLFPFDYDVPHSKLFEKPPLDYLYENTAYQLIALNSAYKSSLILFFMPEYEMSYDWGHNNNLQHLLQKITELNIIALAFVPMRQAPEEMQNYAFHREQVFLRAEEWVRDYQKRFLKNKEMTFLLAGNSGEFYRILAQNERIMGQNIESILAFPPLEKKEFNEEEWKRVVLKAQESQKTTIYLQYDPRDPQEKEFYEACFKPLLSLSSQKYQPLPLCYHQDAGLEIASKVEYFFSHLAYLALFVQYYSEKEMLFQKYVQKRRVHDAVMTIILRKAFEKERLWCLSRVLQSKRVKEYGVISLLKERDSGFLRHIVKLLRDGGYEKEMQPLLQELNLPGADKEEDHPPS